MGRTLIKFPSFDTGTYEGSDFLMSGGDAVLTVRVSEMAPIVVKFFSVRWHQFTAQYNCTAEQVGGAYFAVAEVNDSAALLEYLENDRAPTTAYRELHHYRVFLDETGCHELFAESCAAL